MKEKPESEESIDLKAQERLIGSRTSICLCTDYWSPLSCLTDYRPYQIAQTKACFIKVKAQISTKIHNCNSPEKGELFKIGVMQTKVEFMQDGFNYMFQTTVLF